MKEKPKTSPKAKLVNFFGALGYIFCTLQWLWTALLYFSLINAFVLFISPSANKPVPTPPASAPLIPQSSPLFIILAILITTSMIALTIYVIYKTPSTLAKTSKKIVHNTAESAAPIVLHIQHKKDTKKVHLKLTTTIIILIKMLLLFTPVALAIASNLLEKHMISYDIAIIASLWLAGLGTAAFGLQYTLASILSVTKQELW